jgi:hypothetical protein
LQEKYVEIRTLPFGSFESSDWDDSPKSCDDVIIESGSALEDRKRLTGLGRSEIRVWVFEIGRGFGRATIELMLF